MNEYQHNHTYIMHVLQLYSVENDLDVDFFAALKKMQNPSHDNPELMPAAAAADCNDDDHVCLITNEPLNAFHVELACGHAFNYEPLYQEVLRQKGRTGMHNYFEKIGMHQVKCPYCRSMTNQLLPYIGNSPHPVIKRLVGVNAPASMCMPGTPCGAGKCTANAFYEYAENLYCYRHHQIAMKPKPTPASNATAAVTRCIAENQSGKNKGNRCKLNAAPGSALCKTHAKCDVVVTI